MRKFKINITDVKIGHENYKKLIEEFETKYNLEFHEDFFGGLYFSHYTIDIKTLDDIINITKLLNEFLIGHHIILDEDSLTIKF